MRAQTAFAAFPKHCFRLVMHYSPVTQNILLSWWLQQCYNLQGLLTANCMKRSWVMSVTIRVSGFGHIGISHKNSQEMVSETSGVWFYLRGSSSAFCLTSSTASWMWLSPSPRRLMWSLEHQTAAADHAWRSVGLSVIWNLNSCKDSLWKPIRGQIKLWVSCFWLSRVHISAHQTTGAAVYRLTTRNTCGRRMETMTHLLLFVAIDTPVYPFKWEHHLAAIET